MPLTDTDVRAFGLSLPEAAEDPHFEKNSLRVNKKIFATLSGGAHFVIKLTPEDQSILIDMFSETFVPNKGWGKYGWTEVLYAELTRDQMEDALTRAYKTIAPKRLVKAHFGSA